MDTVLYATDWKRRANNDFQSTRRLMNSQDESFQSCMFNINSVPVHHGDMLHDDEKSHHNISSESYCQKFISRVATHSSIDYWHNPLTLHSLKRRLTTPFFQISRYKRSRIGEHGRIHIEKEGSSFWQTINSLALIYMKRHIVWHRLPVKPVVVNIHRHLSWLTIWLLLYAVRQRSKDVKLTFARLARVTQSSHDTTPPKNIY